jgi:hypothetical protein
MTQQSQNYSATRYRFWHEFVHLKEEAVCICLYRDWLARWVMGIGIVRAVASSATIGAWAIWQDFFIVWAIILGVSQIWEAIKERILSRKDIKHPLKSPRHLKRYL